MAKERLDYQVVRYGDLMIGDIIVDRDWPEFFGRQIVAIHVNEDRISETNGRQVSISMSLGVGHERPTCGITAREHMMLEILR